jgi:hypothetical protein
MGELAGTGNGPSHSSARQQSVLNRTRAFTLSLSAKRAFLHDAFRSPNDALRHGTRRRGRHDSPGARWADQIGNDKSLARGLRRRWGRRHHLPEPDFAGTSAASTSTWRALFSQVTGRGDLHSQYNRNDLSRLRKVVSISWRGLPVSKVEFRADLQNALAI